MANGCQLQAHKTEYNPVEATVVPAQSDSDLTLCLQLLSETLTRTRHLN